MNSGMSGVEVSSMVMKLLPPDEGFVCKACGYRAKRRFLVNRHLLTKHQQLDIECEFCHKIYKNQRSIDRHPCYRMRAAVGHPSVFLEEEHNIPGPSLEFS